MNRDDYLDIDELDYIYTEYIGGKYNLNIKNKRMKFVSSIKNYLKGIDINFIENDDNIYVAKADMIKFEETYKNFNTENYYRNEDVLELLGINIACIKVKNRVIKPVIYKGINYYSKIDVDYFVELKEKIMPITELQDKFGWASPEPVKTIVKKLQQGREEVKLIHPSEHPFGCFYVVSGYEYVIEYAKFEQQINSITDRYEKFKVMISRLEVTNNDIRLTLQDFHEFIKLRYDQTKKLNLINYHTEIYKNLNLFLNNELFKCKETEIQILIKNMKGTKGAEQEFNLFLNFCNGKYKNSTIPNTKFKKKYEKKRFTDDGKSYTEEQWISFKKLVFESIDNREYLSKALESRSCAMTWLYFALHYVMASRRIDMLEMPYVQLGVIGFSKGDDFLYYLKEGGEFTHSMGEIICKEIHMKMAAYGQTATKNGVILKFVVGDSMVRQIGLLFAICEAHRQCAKGKNSVKDKILTRTVRDKKYHLKLFGKEYIKIFGQEMFSNLKATSTLLKQVSNREGELGIYIASVMRGHKSILGKPSSTTANIYI